MLKIHVCINENESSKGQAKHLCDGHYFSSGTRGSGVARSPRGPCCSTPLTLQTWKLPPRAVTCLRPHTKSQRRGHRVGPASLLCPPHDPRHPPLSLMATKSYQSAWHRVGA